LLRASVTLYACTTHFVLRRSFIGLAIETRERIGGNPTSGSLFVFFKRTRTIRKTLWWDTGGFCIFTKKLSKARFKIAALRKYGAQHVQMDVKYLVVILAGLDRSKAKKKDEAQKQRNTPNKIHFSDIFLIPNGVHLS
jgi:transposase